MRVRMWLVLPALLVCGALSAQDAQREQPRAGAGQVPDRTGGGQENRGGASGNQAGQPGAGGQFGTGRQSGTVSGGRAGGNLDQQIAAMIFLDSQKEIEASRFAQSKLQSPEAKQFAEKMVREHGQSHEALRRLAGEYASVLSSADHEGAGATRGTDSSTLPAPRNPGASVTPGTSGRSSDPQAIDAARGTQPGNAGGTTQPGNPPSGTTQPGTTQPGSPRSGAGAAAGQNPGGQPGTTQPGGRLGTSGANAGATASNTGGTSDWVRLHQEIGQRCLASLKQELGSLRGAEFDKAFMGHQVMSHMEMVDKLNVFRNHASGELRQQIDSGLQLTTTHLREAKQIKEQLKDNSGERTTRRPE